MKRLPRLIASLALAITVAGTAQAQKTPNLDGDWTGALSVGGGSLTIVIHLATSGGQTTASLDSPDQGAMGIPAELKKGEGGKIIVEVAAVMGAYTATPSADGKKLSGEWSQLGQTLPLEMVKK